MGNNSSMPNNMSVESEHNTMLVWQARRSGPSSPRQNDFRTPYQRDRARIIHSAAFRRLQSKTQNSCH